eukprot:Selendium_serpulae@DN9200_c0_g1_i1.p2
MIETRVLKIVRNVQRLGRQKAELDLRIAAAIADLEAALEAATRSVGAATDSTAGSTGGGATDTSVESRSGDGRQPAPSNRRHSRAIRFANPLPERKYWTPSRGSRRGTIAKHEGGPSLGNRRILARSTGPRLGQPMRHNKGPTH